METKGHIIKLENGDIDCFIIPIVIIRKNGSSIELTLFSKLLSNQIFKTKYQMSNIHILIDNFAIQLWETPTGRSGLVT